MRSSLPALALLLAPAAGYAPLSGRTHAAHSTVVCAARSPLGRLRQSAAAAPVPVETGSKPKVVFADGEFASVLQAEGELLVLQPRPKAEAPVGARLRFSGEEGEAVIVFERCGLYFAARLDAGGEAPTRGCKVKLVKESNYTCTLPEAPMPEEWAGFYDYTGKRLDGKDEPTKGETEVFAEIVPQYARSPINSPLHTGVVAVDSLTPIGKGQSMLVLGPDTLPMEASRKALTERMLDAVTTLSPDVRTLLVLTTAPAEKEAAIAEVAAQPWAATTRVLVAETPAQALIAAQAACSLAEADGDGDSLVVVDDLALHLDAWKFSCDAIAAEDIDVAAAEEGAQQRAFYSILTERAHRVKGRSVTLLLSQPSASLVSKTAKEVYTTADFEEAGYSNRACERIRLLEERGAKITPEVLTKLGIPAPGSGHPQGDGGRRAGQHLEELTSLVDGHIDLREALADAGRLPPLDPQNSLTRIGVGSHAMRPVSMSQAMQRVTKGLRLDLASAADPVHCEPHQRRRAAACLGMLQQPERAPMALGEEVVLLYAASEGLLDDVAERLSPAEFAALRSRLLEAVTAADSELLPKVTRTEYLADEQLQHLDAVIRAVLSEEEESSAQ